MNQVQPGIAIIGMSGRFPGAPDVGTFWRNLCAGVESISRFEAAGVERSETGAQTQRTLVGARAILDDVEMFDADFFGMDPSEAALTDPQHRIFLDCAWEAFEDAGYDPTSHPRAIGVIAGCGLNSYFLRNVLGDRAAIEAFTGEDRAGSNAQRLGAAPDFLATRVAYKLNLRGPAMTVQTASSTSLIAVVQACQTLLLRQADMMLAGGVSVALPQHRGHRCEAGVGAGAVVLKRLDDAVADGDTVYAVIRGFGVNNDGASKAEFTDPCAGGQAAAIAAAYAMAGFDPQTIRYVECHGSATPQSDPVEFEALARVFSAVPGDGTSCALGSVKSNVGDLEAAAGICALMKTALTIHTGKLPATLHDETPNPRTPIAGSPFFINGELRDWPIGDPHRRAGVSAFGVGGTNVHLALEAGPKRVTVDGAEESHLIVLSARSEATLAIVRTRLAAHVRASPAARLADVAFTLQIGRKAFPYRSTITATTVNEALDQLDAPLGAVAPAPAVPPDVVFQFSAHGREDPAMGRSLYDRLPVFRAAIDRCAAILEPALGGDIRRTMYELHAGPATSGTLPAFISAEPASFCVQYAVANVWIAWGLKPTALIGLGIGELVAATLAGVFSLEGALTLIVERRRLLRALPDGNVPDDLLADFERALSSRVAHIRFALPVIPFISGLTGTWIAPDDAMSPAYWARQAVAGVSRVCELPAPASAARTTLLECGAGADVASMLDALGASWVAGAQPNWAALHAPAVPRRVSLPTYPFQRVRHWIDGPALPAPIIQPPTTLANEAAASIEVSPVAPVIEELPAAPVVDAPTFRPYRADAVAGETAMRSPFVYLHEDPWLDDHYPRRLAARIESNQPFLALAPPPGVGSARALTTEAIALDACARIRECLPDGPYRIGGLRGGAFVAYEVAQLLRARGERVEQLVMIDPLPPPKRALLVGDAMLRRIGLEPHIDPLVRRNRWRIMRTFIELLGSAPEATRRFLKAGDCVRYAYHPRPYDGEVVLVWSETRNISVGDSTRGWDTLARSARVLPITRRATRGPDAQADEIGRLLCQILRDSVH